MPVVEVQAPVINQVRALLRSPEEVVRTWRAAWLDDEQIDEREVVEALHRLDPLSMTTELLEAKIERLEGGRPLTGRRSRS